MRPQVGRTVGGLYTGLSKGEGSLAQPDRSAMGISTRRGRECECEVSMSVSVPWREQGFGMNGSLTWIPSELKPNPTYPPRAPPSHPESLSEGPWHHFRAQPRQLCPACDAPQNLCAHPQGQRRQAVVWLRWSWQRQQLGRTMAGFRARTSDAEDWPVVRPGCSLASPEMPGKGIFVNNKNSCVNR